MGQFLRSQPEVDDYVGGADERSRQRELETHRVVFIQHREVIARAEARRTQRPRRTANPVVKLSPGPALLAEHQRLPVRGFGDPSLNDAEDVPCVGARLVYGRNFFLLSWSPAQRRRSLASHFLLSINRCPRGTARCEACRSPRRGCGTGSGRESETLMMNSFIRCAQSRGVRVALASPSVW